MLLIVETPGDWQPQTIFDVPRVSVPVSKSVVASFDEAYDDLVRCNSYALKNNLDQWAVISLPEQN